MRKVPVIIQMEAVECGAVALCMVLASYGRWIPLEQVRLECGVSRDGSNLLNILKAARKQGLEAHGLRMDIEELRKQDCPCILHWNNDHFVVLRGIRGNRFYLNDPARGAVTESLEQFRENFTGVVLTLKPGPDFKPEGHQTPLMRFLNPRLRRAHEMLFFSFLTGLLLAVSSLALPIFSQLFADVILPGKNPDWTSVFFLTFAAVIVYQLIIQWLQGNYEERLSQQLSLDASSQFLWHVLRLPIYFFSQRYAGDLMMRLRSAENVPNLLVSQLAPLLTNLLLLIIYLVCMVAYSLPLTAIAVGATLLNLLIARFVTEKQINMSRMNERNKNQLAGLTMNSLSSIETIKAAGAEEGFYNRWAGLYTTTTKCQFQIDRTNLWLEVIPQLVTVIANDIVLVLGAYYILSGHLTVGMLMAFQGFMGSYMTPMNSLIGNLKQLFGMRAQMERMEDVFQTPADLSTLDDDRPLGNGKLTGEVELRDVTFGFHPLSDPLISHFNLHLKPGQSVAFVGESGCGKSTLAKLVSGLYQPWSGQVLFDGKHPQEINRNVFVNSVSVVDQEIVLFEGTVSENIKMWDESIEDFAVTLACDNAQIHSDILKLPGAYQGKMEEQGRNFSGGQRQRLEIATALAKEPNILILDEATSALDTQTEEAVMKAVKALGITLIIIAHRLSTIRDCDEIIVLEKGQVRERGSHERLMAEKGVYYQLMQNA